jgi:DNA-binding GntR family transcriptional regulator
VSSAPDPRKYRQLTCELRAAILDGALPPGPAPTITELAARYGWGRQTCARALRALEDEGLLARYPGLGYYVTGSPLARNTGLHDTARL